jgi:hypothetical protein
MVRTIFVAVSALSLMAIGCGSSDSGSGSRTGFGSKGGIGVGTGGGSGSGGSTGVGGGATSGDQHGTGPGDPSTTVDPGQNSTPPDPNAPCNDLTNDGTQLTVTNMSNSMPTANGGGQPLDGHYLLTEVDHYSLTSSNDTYQGLLFISSGLQQYVLSKNGTEIGRTSFSADYTGTALTLTAKCGGSSSTLAYTTSTETQIVIYDAANKLAFTYTRPDPAGN